MIIILADTYRSAIEYLNQAPFVEVEFFSYTNMAGTFSGGQRFKILTDLNLEETAERLRGVHDATFYDWTSPRTKIHKTVKQAIKIAQRRPE